MIAGTTIASVLIAMFLDSVIFPQLNIMGARPDALLAVVVSLSVLMGSFPGALIGLASGLLMDILFNRFLGISAALYMLIGMCSGVFYRKFYADNYIIPVATAAVAALIKELVMAGVAVISGAKFNFGSMMVQYILPCMLMSAALCLLTHLIHKPLLASQIRQSVGRD